MSIGLGLPGVANEAELGQCLVGFSGGGYDPNVCPWFKTPPKPGG